MLWQLLRRLAVPGAFLIAAVFATHPIHVEAVAWVMARKDLLSTLFYLLAALFYLRFRERPTSGAYLAVLALFTAGMLSKSLVITLPAALLVWAWWKHGRVGGRDLLHTMPLFALGFAIAAGDLAFYHARAVIEFDYAWAKRPLIAAKALWFYAAKLLWPYPLIPIYPKWDVAPANLLNWLPLLAGMILLFALWRARHRVGRGPLAAVSLFIILLSPTLGFFINVFMQFSFAADRYQYLASAVLIAALVASAVTACRRLSPPANHTARGCAALLLAAYSVLTFRQTFVYQDDAAFWSHIIAHNPRAHGGYYNLGLALVSAGRIEEGIDAYRKELAREPDLGGDPVAGAAPKPDAGTYINLSFALLQLQRFEEAARVAQQAVDADPKALLAHQNLASALHSLKRYEETLAALQQVGKLMKKPTAEHQYHLGHIAALLGRIDEAEGYLLQALALDPTYQEARQQLLFTYLDAGRYEQARALSADFERTLSQIAAARFRDGRYEAALQHYRHLIAIAPNDSEAHVNIGATLMRLKRTEEAMQSYRRALAIDPEQRQGLTQLGYAYFQLGDDERALEAYRRLADLAPDDAATHVNIAVTLARMRRMREAEASFQRALELDPTQTEALRQFAALCFNDGRYRQAVSLYRRVVALRPDNAQDHADLGAALAQVGKLSEAMQSFERALELDPRLETARSNLEQAREKLERGP